MGTDRAPGGSDRDAAGGGPASSARPAESPTAAAPDAAPGAGEEQREALLSMGLLAAGLVHEVKNSLTGVLGLLQLARRDDADEAMREGQLERLEREVRSCVDRLNRYLSLRPDSASAGRVAVCAPGEAVEEAAGLVRHALQMKGIRLEVAAVPEHLPLVAIAVSDLRGVLVNLLLNAMQALGSSGSVSVEASARAEGGVQIEVTDDGPGVPEDLRTRIFQPLMTTRAPGEGTGLGLHITRQLIEGAGGRVFLDSEYRRGARFVVELPPHRRTGRPPRPDSDPAGRADR